MKRLKTKIAESLIEAIDGASSQVLSKRNTIRFLRTVDGTISFQILPTERLYPPKGDVWIDDSELILREPDVRPTVEGIYTDEEVVEALKEVFPGMPVKVNPSNPQIFPEVQIEGKKRFEDFLINAIETS